MRVVKRETDGTFAVKVLIDFSFSRIITGSNYMAKTINNSHAYNISYCTWLKQEKAFLQNYKVLNAR